MLQCPYDGITLGPSYSKLEFILKSANFIRVEPKICHLPFCNLDTSNLVKGIILPMEEENNWIIAARKGNRIAFRRMVEKYQNYVFTIALRVVGNRETAEEVAQDVFLKVYHTLDSFEGKSKFSTWLYTIAYRAAIDVARKKQLRTELLNDERTGNQQDDLHEDGFDRVNRMDLQRQLEQAIQQLPQEDATIVTLYYLHEKMVREIAEITGLTETNIKTKLHRLRDKLREKLSQQLGAEIEDLL